MKDYKQPDESEFLTSDIVATGFRLSKKKSNQHVHLGSDEAIKNE